MSAMNGFALSSFRAIGLQDQDKRSVKFECLIKACAKIIESIVSWVPPMGSVTNVLNQGSLAAAMADKELQLLLYQELKIIASAKLRKHGPSHNNTTALVHEAFIKLTKNTSHKHWTDRHHFFSTAALAMRQILVDQARRHLAEKRGAGQVSEGLHDNHQPLQQECAELVDLNGALEQLMQVDPDLVDLVNLKFFVGLSMPEIAEMTGLSVRTLERQWHKIKMMLHVCLSD